MFRQTIKSMDWSKLNKQQLGKYGEYIAKMELIKYGLDVYSSEIDDHGIDFVIRKDGQQYFDIQVKAIRRKSCSSSLGPAGC